MNETKIGGEANGIDGHKPTNQILPSAQTFEIVRQQRFDVGPRYTDLKFIGEGAYVEETLSLLWQTFAFLSRTIN
ncbi:unnamed protein product [Rotaria socialis]|uniref:Uncharacterized protein n=1 Tax=Rotaria socialis TaxID=392032 RepID=A0A821HSL2_9BILA|nr:unnamed protein product [Rotaria socialis]